MADPVIVGIESIDDGMIAKVTGEIDLVRSPLLRHELMSLLRQPHERIVIDLSGVPYMDSSGVATLVEVLQVQRKHNRKLILCGMQNKVRSIFEIARLDMIFTIVGDAHSAAQA